MASQSCHAFIFCIGLTMGALYSACGAAQEVQWTDAASLEVEGKGWADTAGLHDRLPGSAKGKVNPSAWGLSKDSAGICIRFVTDASAVSVRWSLTKERLDMHHMPSTGVSGVDLYARTADGAWRFVGNGIPRGKDTNVAKFEFPEVIEAPRECLLYLPLYNGTSSLEIGVPEGAALEQAPPRPEGRRRPLAVYGTSITQGGCASRPGMAWPAILGRLLDRPVLNLGFSGSGIMETTIGDVLAELDPAAYLIACTWNMGDSQEVYHERVSALVHALRQAHEDTPILFVGQSFIHPEEHPTDLSQRLENAVRRVQEDGFEGVTFIPGEHLIGYDGEATVDGVHLTDIGMDRQARSLLRAVREAVEGPEKHHVYIDTDTAAEGDDSFAVFRALVAPEFNVVGLSAMGFDPSDFGASTRASQQMNAEILDLMGMKEDISHPLGALNPMPEAYTPVDSPAARDIIANAKETPIGRKLHVFVLGAYTNIASALLLDPSVRGNIAVYVMGFRVQDGEFVANESNCQGDLHAAAYLLESGVELHIMSSTALRHFRWAKANVDAHFKGKGGMRDYLVRRWETYAPNDADRVVWDIAVFEAFLRPKLATSTYIEHEGSRIHTWIDVDVEGMKADYWAATKAAGF